MIQLAATVPSYLILMIIPLIAIVFTMFGTVLLLRCYRKPPPGKVMVIKKVTGRVDVTRSGSVVWPSLWSYCFVHCEVEEIELNKDDGSTESLFVCLDDDPQSAIYAMDKLGDRPVEEIKRLIARMLKKSNDHEKTLAKIGYKIVV